MNTKKCRHCNIEKSKSDFSRDSYQVDDLSKYCKSCKKEYNKTWKVNNADRVKSYEKEYRKNGPKRIKRSTIGKDNRSYILELKTNGKCSNCGYSKIPEILQYHHIDAIKKKFALSSPGVRSLDEITSEISKCKLLCPTCHSEEHYYNKKNKNPSKTWKIKSYNIPI